MQSGYYHIKKLNNINIINIIFIIRRKIIGMIIDMGSLPFFDARTKGRGGITLQGRFTQITSLFWEGQLMNLICQFIKNVVFTLVGLFFIIPVIIFLELAGEEDKACCLQDRYFWTRR